jgi:hypothetical protein
MHLIARNLYQGAYPVGLGSLSTRYREYTGRCGSGIRGSFFRGGRACCPPSLSLRQRRTRSKNLPVVQSPDQGSKKRQLAAPSSARFIRAGSSRQPSLQDAKHVIDLVVSQGASLGNSMPLCQATSATGGRGVLGHERGMASQGRLLAVVGRLGRGQPRKNEAASLVEHQRKSLPVQIGLVPRIEAETAAKPAALKGGEQLVQIPHVGKAQVENINSAAALAGPRRRQFRQRSDR